MKQQSSEVTVVDIVRHTDVENPGNIYYGRLPQYRLSMLGREQAARTAEALSREELSAVYSSPMIRARETARAIATHHGVTPTVTWLLAEVRSAWQGRTFDELDAIGYDFYSRPLHASDETLEQVWARLVEFTLTARARHAGGHVVGVTHGDICMLARACFVGLPVALESIRKPHVYAGKGSITRLTFGPGLKETHPQSVHYYDPNGENSNWSAGFMRVPPEGARR